MPVRLSGPAVAAAAWLAARRALIRRRRNGPPRQASGTSHGGTAAERRVIWLCRLSAVALLVIPPVTADFDYRYMLPVLPLGCLAAVLAVRRYLVTTGRVNVGGMPGGCGNSGTANIRTIHELSASDG